MIRKIGYMPVGLGNNIKSNAFLKDNTKDNISDRNPFYGEYSFHYWLWKNNLNELNHNWIGFCQYRKFWVKDKKDKKIKSFNDLDEQLLKNIPKEYDKFESILGEPLYVNQFRFSKFIKRNFLTMIKKPILFLDKKKRNLRFHFDMMHGRGNLSKAINLLEKTDKHDFEFFLDNSVSFNPHNMFICKSKEILKKYYQSVFPWLKRCEKEFGFDLKGYGQRRIYGFLAERYMSYWFKKYTKFKIMPIIFKDISELGN